MTHEKKKMTRAEAIASLQKHVPVNDPAAIIDFYIEAGMLEIVEEPDYRKSISKIFGVDEPD